MHQHKATWCVAHTAQHRQQPKP